MNLKWTVAVEVIFKINSKVRSEFISSAVEYSVDNSQMDRCDSEKQLDE
jgi:hypothetical protein